MDTRARWLFGGALLGCLLAGAQILKDVHVPVELVGGAAARVNGRSIDAASVQRTVMGFDARLRADEPAARGRVLSRMIDEELLVQHALDAGTAASDPEVRAALVRAAINRVNAEVAASPLHSRDVEAFYRSHREAYATQPRFEIIPLYFDAPAFPDLRGAVNRANAVRTRLGAGESAAALSRESDPLPFVPPGAWATPATLANYFPADIVRSIGPVPSGGCTEPLPFGRGVLLVHVSRRQEAEMPSLETVRDLVEADTLRAQQDAALAALLDSLRRDAHIDIAPAYELAAAH